MKSLKLLLLDHLVDKEKGEEFAWMKRKAADREERLPSMERRTYRLTTESTNSRQNT